MQASQAISTKTVLTLVLALGAGAVPAWAKGGAKVDPTASTLEFTAIGKPGFLRINGKDAKLTGTATSEGTTWKGDFETKLDEFNTGIETRDEHMKKKYLETDKFPTAKLAWTAAIASFDAAQDVPFEGTLTLHGVEHKVSGKAKVEPASDKKKVKVEVTMPIKLSDFKIEVPTYLGVTVAEEVEVRAYVTVDRQD